MKDDESDTGGNRAAPVQLKALANERRRRIMFVLRAGSASAAALAEQLRAPKGSVIYHLEVLERSGMVVRDGTHTVRGGTQVTWRVAAPAFEGETGEAGVRAQEKNASGLNNGPRARPCFTLYHKRTLPQAL